MSTATVAPVQITAPVAVERPALPSGPGRPKRDNPFTELLKPLISDQTLTHAVTLAVKSDSKEAGRAVLDIRAAAKDAGLTACVRSEAGGTAKEPKTVLTYWLRPAIKRPRSEAAVASTPATK